MVLKKDVEDEKDRRYYTQSREVDHSLYVQYEERYLTGVVTFCVGSLLKFLIKEKIEGIEVTGRRGRRREQLLDDLKEREEFWELKSEAPDRTLWRTHFGRGLS